ncbi:MAG: hypothetical protein J2P18_19870 [Nocardia sp.]|nr:hypothetical protein [Nocardia sp.]
MTQPDKPPTSGPGPFAAMVNEAKNGNIRMRMDLEEFVHMDRACQKMIDNIFQIQRIMHEVSEATHWGLGEDYRGPDGKTLISGQKVVERFKTKSKAPGDSETNYSSNSVWAVMESHRRAVLDIQAMYREARKQITDADAEAAARYKQLEQTLPQRPAPPREPFHARGLPPKHPK